MLRTAVPFLLGLASAYSPGSEVARRQLRGVFGGGDPDPVLACPVSKAGLTAEVTVVGGQVRRMLKARGTAYPVNEVYADLTPRSSTPIGLDQLADELFSVFSMQTGIFRTPLMAWYYERGWRQNFNAMGFPGIDKEFAEASEFFGPVADGGTVADISCGTGLMARRLVGSGRYARCLALDFSEEMLRETSRRFEDERVQKSCQLSLVRADAAALPLATGAVDAVHAGAALHCWPRLEEALAEVARSLKPGGRFYATTFFEGAMGTQQLQGSGSMRMFKDAAELEGLLIDAGFDPKTLDVRREGRACAIIRAEAL